MHFTPGNPGFSYLYGLSAVGVLVAFIRAEAPLRRMLFIPVIALGVCILAEIVWTALMFFLIPALGNAPNGIKIPIASAFFVLCGILSGLILAKESPNSNHQRGALLHPSVLPSPPHSTGPGATLTLAGLPVAPLDETKHFKFIGTTGTGKSTAIAELVEGALERGDRAAIADPDGSYLSRFYRPSRGDVILNPFNEHAARWDLFAEMTTLFDADQLAHSLIADAEGSEGPWRNYARVFLTSVLRQLHRVHHNDVGELYQLISTAPIDDLRDLLADTPAGSYLTQDNGKFFSSVRAVANTHLGALEHIARQTSDKSLSVREWVRRGRGRGGVLFLPYRANEIASLRCLISTWMRLAIFEAMSQPEGDQKLWFIADELDALGPIDGLKDALARLRKFGGRCALGFQSIGQVSGTYGHAGAQTIVENCGNTLILRCSSSEGGGTARFASQLIGDREVMRKHKTQGRSGTPLFLNNHHSESTSFQPTIESAVLPSEIEQLPDLHGYLKFASSPHWSPVQLKHPGRL